MKLVKATIDTILSLQKICMEAYATNFHHHWEENGLDLYLESQFSQEQLRKDIASVHKAYYFIKHKGTSVGFLKINKNASLPDDSFPEKVCELEKIYVLPDCKGQGIGQFALSSIIKLLQEEKRKTLFLCVIDANLDAIAFYKKIGFQLHSKTRLEAPFFKESLKGMNRMVLTLED